MDEQMMTITDIDKLTESYTLRIPEITKDKLEKLSSVQKRQLNEDIMVCMAKHLHNSTFDYRLYLKSE